MNVAQNAVGSGDTAHMGSETLGATARSTPVETPSAETEQAPVEVTAADTPTSPTSETQAATPPESEVSKLDRAKAAADKAKRIASRKRAQAQEQAQLRQRAETAAQEAQRYQAEARQLGELQARLKKSPLDVLREQGVTANSVLDRAAEEHSPQGQLDSFKREFTAQLESERAARRQLEQQIQSERQAVHIEREKAKFVATVSDEKKFPALSGLPPQFVLAAAQSTYSEAVSKGYTPTDEEVLETLEDLYSSHTAKRTKSAGGSHNGTPTATGANGKASPTPPRTITNGMASAKASAPTDYESLPDDFARKEYLARMLEAYKPAKQ